MNMIVICATFAGGILLGMLAVAILQSVCRLAGDWFWAVDYRFGLTSDGRYMRNLRRENEARARVHHFAD